MWSQDSAAVVATGLRAERSGVQIMAKAKMFLVSLRAQTVSRPHPVCYSMGTGFMTWRITWPGRESCHSPQSRAKGKNEWRSLVYRCGFAGINLPFTFNIIHNSVDKKNQLDVTFCILYFSSNSCSTCFGQPCAHHQELTTA